MDQIVEASFFGNKIGFESVLIESAFGNGAQAGDFYLRENFFCFFISQHFEEMGDGGGAGEENPGSALVR